MKFSRVVLKVKDYRQSFEFYHDLLGLKMTTSWQREDSWGAIFSVGPSSVEIIWYPQGDGFDDCNYVLERQKIELFFDADDVDIMFQRLVDKGADVIKKPFNAAWGYRLFKIKDPDGIPVAFIEPVK